MAANEFADAHGVELLPLNLGDYAPTAFLRKPWAKEQCADCRAEIPLEMSTGGCEEYGGPYVPPHLIHVERDEKGYVRCWRSCTRRSK